MIARHGHAVFLFGLVHGVGTETGMRAYPMYFPGIWGSTDLTKHERVSWT